MDTLIVIGTNQPEDIPMHVKLIEDAKRAALLARNADPAIRRQGRELMRELSLRYGQAVTAQRQAISLPEPAEEALKL